MKKLHSSKNNKLKVSSAKHIFSSGQVDIPEKSSKKDIQALIKKHLPMGKYTHISLDKSKIFFCKTAGYFYPEQVCWYKKRPSKYIYIAKTSDYYEIVSIISGRIFYEGITNELSFCQKQLYICAAYNNEELIFESFGIDESIIQNWLNEAKRSISHTMLLDPISNNLKRSSKFLLVNYNRDKGSKRGLIIALTSLIALLLIGGYFMHQKNTLTSKKTYNLTTIIKHVDRYENYKRAFLTHPQGKDIVKSISESMLKLRNAYGSIAAISQINYRSPNIVYQLSVKDIKRLNIADFEAIANQEKLNLSIGSLSALKLSVKDKVKIKQDNVVSEITPVSREVLGYVDVLRANYDFVNHLSYQVLRTTKLKHYKQIILNLKLSQLTFNQIISVLTYIDYYPARILAFDLHDSKLSLGLYNIALNIGFWGE
ncbi:MAG: hypothetical protein ACRY3E_00240 [Candidatus Lariskella arthropodorum]